MSKLEISGAEIQAVGSFNPVIFQPVWFRKFKIFPEHEISFVENNQYLSNKDDHVLEPVLLITPDMVRIHFKSFLLFVTRDKFVLTLKNIDKKEEFAGIFNKIFLLLPHTPLHAYGNNFKFNISLDDSDAKVIREKYKKSVLLHDLVDGDTIAGIKIVREIKDGFLPLQLTISIDPENSDYSRLNVSTNSHRLFKVETNINEYFENYFKNDYELDEKDLTSTLDNYIDSMLKEK